VLTSDHRTLRALVKEFLAYLRQRTPKHGYKRKGPMCDWIVADYAQSVELFYRDMANNKDDVAAELGDPRWRELSANHMHFWLPGERPQTRRGGRAPVDDSNFVPQEIFNAARDNSHLLGDPVGAGGFGQPQVERLLLLAMKTGRRMSELLMLDENPLLPVLGFEDEQGEVRAAARLKYAQTKIDGAPNTMLVDPEVVAIVRTQREWRDAELARRGAADPPKFLFIAHQGNLFGSRHIALSSVHRVLRRFAERLDLRDEHGRLFEPSKTHRFRHTRATILAAAGCSITVLQRDLGHMSPAMSAVYIARRDEDEEAAFVEMQKYDATGRELDIDRRALYEMLQLDRRADRILPHGYCLLPHGDCNKGNACLTCGDFATDVRFDGDLRRQLDETKELVERRKAFFRERHGREMPPDNVWLKERLKEIRALEERLLPALEQAARNPNPLTVTVVGAGAGARHA
jgi:integrase